MTQPTGTTWQVDRIVKVVDGDSLRVVRTRLIDLDGRHYQLTDADPNGVLLRLAWIDTPEKGRPGWAQARADLAVWCTTRTAPGPLAAVCYESAGWDRLLADLRDSTGASASQWLMADRGWPAYVDGAA
jgi:endonuclease YncB( thermonuclease family)